MWVSQVWFVNSQHDRNPAGYVRCIPISRGGAPAAGPSSSRFCYAVIRNAGHESPAYQPRASFDLLSRFMEKRAWDASGDDAGLPTCGQCSGVGPFAGAALPECNIH